MSKQETKPETVTKEGLRPIGLSIASFFYVASGIYYLVFPIVASDPGIWPLYVIGGLSVLTGFGVFRMTKWGLWLGLALFPPQLIVALFTFLTVWGTAGWTQQPISIAFAASLVVLMFFATLSFLLILDKRRTFK